MRRAPLHTIPLDARPYAARLLALIARGGDDGTACRWCGNATAMPKRGPRPRYCTRRCRTAAENERHRAARNAAKSRWRARNPEKAKRRREGYWREYYARNRERLRAAHRRYWHRRRERRAS